MHPSSAELLRPALTHRPWHTLSDDPIRSKIDDDAVFRTNIARINDRPVHPMSALLDRCLRQPNQHRLRKSAWRNVNLYLDGNGIDTNHRKGTQLRQHGTPVHRRMGTDIQTRPPQGTKLPHQM